MKTKSNSLKKMKKGKFLGLGLCFALIISPLLFLAHHNSQSKIAEVEAADYSGGSSGFSRGSDGSVTATFTVTNNGCDMRGWLLCLFQNEPSYNSTTRKINGSNDIHPYSYSNCKYYFFVSSTKATGTISVTWAASSKSQKPNWSASDGTASAGSRLVDYIDNGTNWHLVVGPRHYNTSWGDSGYGAGTQGYWENCDYYIGPMTNVFPTEDKDMSVTVTPVTKTYNGAASSLGIKVKDPSSGYTIKYRTASSGSYNLTTNPEYTNAGTYTTYFQVTSSGYKTYEGSGTVTINKANPIYTAPTAKSSLTYTGSDQALLNAGSSEVLYSLDGTNYSTDIPTGKNAGTYTVYYKVDETPNYKSLNPQTLTVKINKADPVYTAPVAKTNLVYNEQAQELVNAGSSTSGTILYSLYGENYSSDVPTATDAETYTVYYKIEETDNYKPLEVKSINVSIAKATPIYTAPTAKANLVYNEQAQELVNAGSSTSGTILYSLDNNNYSENIPTATNAGTYTLYYKIEETANYEGYGPISFDVTIDKASPIYTAPTAKSQLVYDGSNQALVNAGSSNILYSLDGNTYSSTIPTGNSAGTYTVYYKIEETDNYYGLEPQTIVISIAKAEPIYTAPIAKTNLVYNEQAQELVNAGSSTSGTILYSLDNNNYSENIPTATNAGSYTVYYKILETPNYKPLEVKTINVSIAKAQATYINTPTAKAGLFYNAEEQPLVTTGTSKGGQVKYSLDNETYSIDVPTKMYVGTYTVFFMIEGDNNYIGIAPQSVSVSIYENDKTALNAVIELANEYIEAIIKEYPDIAIELNDIYEMAQAVSGNVNKTVEEITEARQALLDAIDAAHAKVVDVLIEEIGDVRFTESCLEDIITAEEAYDDLTPEQKALVKKLNKLNASRTLYNKLEEVAKVIAAIGEVTYDDETYDRILAAKEAFATLTEEEQLLIPTIFNELTSKEDIYDMLKIIANLGDVVYTEEYRDLLEEARNAFDALDLNEQSAVYNYQALLDAEKMYNHIDEVVKLVNAIDENLEYVGTHNPDIDKARAAYNSLTEEEKALVPELTIEVLEAKEEEYEEIKIEHERREAEDREAGVAIAIDGASGIPDTVSIDINSSNNNQEDFSDNVDYQTISDTLPDDEEIASMCEIKFYEDVDGETREISLDEIDENLTITVKINLPDGVDEDNFKVILLDDENNIIDVEYVYDPVNRVIIVTSNRIGTFAIVSTNTHATAKTNDLPLAIILATGSTLLIGVCGFFAIKRKKDKEIG